MKEFFSKVRKFFKVISRLLFGVWGISDSFGPITVYFPKFAKVECPKCWKKFNFLVGGANIDASLPYPPNHCPHCLGLFDDNFYEALRFKYSVFTLKNLGVSKKYSRDSNIIRKKNLKKDDKEYIFLAEQKLLIQYVKEGLAESRQLTSDEIKKGMVWFSFDHSY